MKIALSWLKNYLDLSGTDAELSELLTFAGIEVEGITRIPALGPTVIAAKVISAEPVPKTDHLKLCRVFIGEADYPPKNEDNEIQVICGAANCESGMMAVLGLPGTKLQDMTIKKAKIRGIHSHGMLCSERELGLSENHAGIIRLADDVKTGTLADELYQLPDTVYDLEITPDRSDLLGYVGIARDLSAKLNRNLMVPEIPQISASEADPKLSLFNEAEDLCPRYTARVIKSVKIGPSPLWLKRALIKNGLRPINNIVDITNYVMLETGHPLHAFDYDKLAARDDAQGHPDIVVRRALGKEEFIALDGKRYELDGDELVIADGKRVSALAGVMGSEFSAIDDNTCNIVLESAAFDAASIRRTSYKHKLGTDSSYRFERHLSAELTERISDRATALIQELADGLVCGEILDSYPRVEKELILGVRPQRFEHLIGYTLPDDNIRGILENLGFSFLQYGAFQPGAIAGPAEIPSLDDRDIKEGSGESGRQRAHYYRVPSHRKDVTREADILEELARLAGYDLVPRRTGLQQIMDRHAYKIHKQATDWLVDWGCFETLNYSFCDPDQMQALGFPEDDPQYVRLVNPQSSNQSVMRISLLPQLLTNLAYNLNHAERDIKLFELGKVYRKTSSRHEEDMHLAAIFTGNQDAAHWQNKGEAIDFFWIKGCFCGLLDLLGIDYEAKPSALPYLSPSESFSYFHGDQPLGSFGRIKAPVLEAWDIDANELKQDVWTLDFDMQSLVRLSRDINLQYVDIPRFPAVTRDLSFLISDEYEYSDLHQSIMVLNQGLISSVEVFDEYRSEQIPQGFRSLSLHLTLQDQEKTLTDERVDHLMALVRKALETKYEIKLR